MPPDVRAALKHGGDRDREPDEADIARPRSERFLALDEALDRLATADPGAAELVKLRYFAGFSGRGGCVPARNLGADRRPDLGLRPGLAV